MPKNCLLAYIYKIQRNLSSSPFLDHALPFQLSTPFLQEFFNLKISLRICMPARKSPVMGFAKWGVNTASPIYFDQILENDFENYQHRTICPHSHLSLKLLTLVQKV